MVALKIQGCPFNIRQRDIRQFFQDYNIYRQSIVLGVDNGGRKNGYATILFQNKEEASLALNNLEGEFLGPP